MKSKRNTKGSACLFDYVFKRDVVNYLLLDLNSQEANQLFSVCVWGGGGVNQGDMKKNVILFITI